MSRAIADASFSEIVRQLGYKAQQVVRLDSFSPSSKTCTECGHINTDLTLANRVWTSPACGMVLDRDGNAVRNRRDERMRPVSAATSGRKTRLWTAWKTRLRAQCRMKQAFHM
ncbi:MAG: transposase [Chloroflexaceae bacterium]|nr:transposase [Chloroflexaceae bacterium]